MPISRILIPQDVQMPGDEKGKRKKTRTEELRSGTLYGQYQLRGSVLTIKDASTTASGYMAFGTDMTTIPTSSTAGTGIYIDYSGIYGLASNVQQFYLLAADGKAYAAAGKVVIDVNAITLRAEASPAGTYIKWVTVGAEKLGEVFSDYGGNVGGIYMRGYGKDGTYSKGYVALDATNFGATKSGVVTLYSDGTLLIDLRSGSNTTVSTQAVTIDTQTSATNVAQNGFYLDAYTSGTAAAGFGSQIALRGEDNGGTVRDMITLGGTWDVATSASRRSRVVLGAYTVGTAKTVMSVPYFARVGSMYNKDTSGGTEVSNTATETSIFSCTIEANELGTDGVMRLNIGGDVQQNSGAPINLTFRVKYGGSTVTTTRVAVATFAGTGGWYLQSMLCNAASASAQRGYTKVIIGKNTTFSDSAADYGTASVSSASDQTLSVTVQWASADATAKVFSKSTFVELFPS